MGTLASGSIDLKSLKVAGEGASKYITEIDENGIKIHAINNPNLNYTKINTDGMEIYKTNGTDSPSAVLVAKFGETVQIGENTTASSRIIIDNDGLRIYAKGQTNPTANFGRATNTVAGQEQQYIYYTFGSRDPDETPGASSVAQGQAVSASGYISHAEGYFTRASGVASHAEGYGSSALYVSDYNIQATGRGSHAEGYAYNVSGKIIASGQGAHAEGSASNMDTIASGIGAHAEGSATKATGNYSHAEGFNTTASGVYSHAAGCGTKATINYQTVFGKYNEIDSNAMFIVGNGTDDNNRSNLMVIGENSITIGSTGGMHMALDPNNGLEVFDENNSIAVFGNEARIGIDGANRVELDSTSIALITSNNENALRSEVSGTAVSGIVSIQDINEALSSDSEQTFELALGNVQTEDTFWVRFRTETRGMLVKWAQPGGIVALRKKYNAVVDELSFAFTKASTGEQKKSASLTVATSYVISNDYSSDVQISSSAMVSLDLIYNAGNNTLTVTTGIYNSELPTNEHSHREKGHDSGHSYTYTVGTRLGSCRVYAVSVEAEQDRYLPKTQINGRTYLALNSDLAIPDRYDQAIKSAITTMSWGTDCIENGELNLKALLMKLLGGASETDTDGIWTIRKWADGTAECWGTHIGTYNLTQSYNTAWYNNTTVEIDLPSGLFTGEPTVTVARQGRQGQGLISISPYSVTASKIGVFIFNTGMSLSHEPLGISIHAIGRWK